MRLSPFGPDPLDPGPRGFAHRGLHFGTQFPENSYRAFAAALEFGCGIECDLRLTRDNQVLVFHDANAWRLCGSPLVIGASTAAELSRLSVGERPIPTLAGLLQLVDGHVPILLEVKVDGDFWRWAHALGPLLQSYRGSFGVMSFDPRLPLLIHSRFPGVRAGLVTAANLPPLKRRMSIALANPDFMAVEVAALEQPWLERVRRRMPVYSWTVRSPADREMVAKFADAPIWEGDGRP